MLWSQYSMGDKSQIHINISNTWQANDDDYEDTDYDSW